ncbi:SAF domain-containing protein [uncultured Jatrophihabitans sp.]|uniref:SAF domain-containing protein n=1 Tax=uncultured Jatrophihabitans sp. TaxID=1610747 RepID=UPI0035CBE44C
MAAPSPEPRRIATPRWLDLRLVLGVVLVIAAVLIGATVVSRASNTHAMVAARHDLAAGTVLRSADLTTVDVQLPDDGKGVYLAKVGDAVGRKLDRAVSSGELVPSAAVASVRGGTTVTVPFAAGAAPDLRTGQRIKVWVSSATCASVVLLPDVTVQSARKGNGSLSSTSDGQDVVIAVEPDQADRVIAALAIDGAQIRAGVLVGAVPADDSASAAPAPAAGQLPSDLAACASPAR